MEETNLPFERLSTLTEKQQKYCRELERGLVDRFLAENEENVGYYKAVVSAIYEYHGKEAPSVLIGNCDKFYVPGVDDYIVYYLYIDLDEMTICVDIQDLETFDQEIVDVYGLNDRTYRKLEYGEETGTIFFDEDIFDDIMEDIIARSRFVPILITKLSLSTPHRYAMIEKYATTIASLPEDIIHPNSYQMAEYVACKNLLEWVNTLEFKPNPNAKYYIESSMAIIPANCNEDIKCKLRRYKDE